MKIYFPSLLIFLFTLSSFASIPDFRFSGAPESAEFMRREDDFTKSLNSFDRSVRVGSPDNIDMNAFLQFTGDQMQDWTQEEKRFVEIGLKAFLDEISQQNLDLPVIPTIQLIKSNGNEDLSMYTRRNAIVFYPWFFKMDPVKVMRIISHEVFHILSRYQPQIRNDLYSLVQFQSCGALEVDDELNDQIFTNPDAFHYDSFIEVTHKDGSKYKVMPFYTHELNQSEVTSETKKNFSFLKTQLLAIELNQHNQCTPLAGVKKFLDIADTDYLDVLKADTSYTDHPEEVLADEFALLFKKDPSGQPVTSPVIEAVRKYFQNSTKENL